MNTLLVDVRRGGNSYPVCLWLGKPWGKKHLWGHPSWNSIRTRDQPQRPRHDADATGIKSHMRHLLANASALSKLLDKYAGLRNCLLRGEIW